MRRLAFVSLVLLLVGAGKPKKAPEPPPPEPARAEDLAADMVRSMKMSSSSRVVAPGAEPRRPLTLRLAPGTVTESETAITMDMAMRMTLPDGTSQEMPAMPMPTMVIGQRTVVGQPGADGTTRVKVETTGGRTEGGDPAMQAGMDAMKGMVIELVVDAAGRPVSMEMQNHADPAMAAALDSLGEQMSRSMNVFPAEPVGLGGSWITTMELSMAGMTLVGDQTYTLTAVDDTHADLTVDLVLRVGDGGLAFPGLPEGAKIDVRKLDAKGTGTTRVDLASMVTTGKMNTRIDMEMAVAGLAEGPPMVMAMSMNQITEMRTLK